MSSRSQLHLDELPRSSGHAALSVEVVDGLSSVISLRAHSPMKLLSPISRGKSVWACTSSFGGGMVAGDETVLDLRLGEGARCHVSSQASTKIYRNPSGLPCGHRTHASLGPGSFLSFVPDPVQAFAGARYAQVQEFELGEGAGLVLVDWFGSGRAACGERWAFEHYSSRTKVVISQEPRFVDALYLKVPMDRWRDSIDWAVSTAWPRWFSSGNCHPATAFESLRRLGTVQ